MNEQERVELLKRVAEVAPKEMGAKLVQFPIEYECEGVEGIDWDVRHVKFTKCERTTFDGRLGSQSPKLYLDGTIDDAAPCFAMLDAMETPARVDSTARRTRRTQALHHSSVY